MAEFFPVYWNRENFKSFRKDLGLSAQDGPFSVELSAILIVLPGDLQSIDSCWRRETFLQWCSHWTVPVPLLPFALAPVPKVVTVRFTELAQLQL